MDKIVNILIEELGEEFSRLRLSNCQLYSKLKKLDFEFILPSDVYDNHYNNEIEGKILSSLKTNCGPSFTIVFKVRKTYSDVHIVRNHIFNFMSEKFPIAAAEMKPKNFAIEGSSPEYYVEIKLPSHLYTYLGASTFTQDLLRSLEGEFCDSFNLVLSEDKSLNSGSNLTELASGHEKIYNPLTVGVTLNRVLIGSEIRQQPRQIKALKGDTQSAVCGRVSLWNKRTAKTSGKLFYKFTLSDPTGSVDVLYFPRGNNPEQIETMVREGDEIVIYGDVRDSDFGRSVFVKDIMNCKIDWESVEGAGVLKDAPLYYTFVEPTPFEIIEQDSMFEKEKVCSYLEGKTFVIFDFETTGLDTNTCNVIEVGALKMVNGKIVEEFSTFAKPDKPLTEDITELTSITQEMVEDKPSFTQILPDFLKFCKDAILVAHNQEYDIKILSRYCRDEGYKFENLSQCTLALSNKYLPQLKSHSLAKVSEYYGFVNQHAHRAIGDVEVTAKIFVKLAENIV